MAATDRPTKFPGRPDFIGRHVRDAFTQLTLELDQRLAADHPEVTPAINRIMVLIDREGSRPADLARRAQITRQSVGETVAAMRDLGLVRLDPDPADGRGKLVVLTDRGWAAMKDGLGAALDVHAHWEAVLGERKMAQLMKLLGELLDGLEAEQAENPQRIRDVSSTLIIRQ